MVFWGKKEHGLVLQIITNGLGGLGQKELSTLNVFENPEDGSRGAAKRREKGILGEGRIEERHGKWCHYYGIRHTYTLKREGHGDEGNGHLQF